MMVMHYVYYNVKIDILLLLVYTNKRNIPYLTDEIAAEAAARLDAEDDIPVKVEELVDTELVLPEVHVVPLLIEVEVSDYKKL